jgi:AcrR family transcriptional regulator
VTEPPVRRRYQSPVRADAARLTRQRIVAAARELLLARGYYGCSIGDIAVRAQVARPTVVAAFGTKAAVLRVVVDQALAGDDEPVPVAQRPWFRPVLEAMTQEQCLAAYAGVCVLLGGRAAGVLEAVRRAADSGPELAEYWAEVQRNRRSGAQLVVDRVRTLGPLRTPLSRSRATDVLWVWNDLSLYNTLVTDCGWSPRVFQRWLAEQMSRSLLP